MAPLRGPNRLVYALGQGPIAGIPKGVSRADALPAEELANLSIGSRMVASVGHVHGGAIVEREISLNLNSRARLYMNLHSPDFTTAFRLAKLINQNLGIRSARAQDAGTVEVSVPDSYLGNTVELVSSFALANILDAAVHTKVFVERFWRFQHEKVAYLFPCQI